MALDGDSVKDGAEGFDKEIEHLRRRARNVQASLHTSQGLSNPRKWTTNCLFPVRNVVRQWRSILMFHSLVVEGSVSDHLGEGDEVDVDECDLLGAASQEVFDLIQVSMQTGPLVGSNAGYFKRCGGEVATMAFDFLNSIIELVEVEGRVCLRGGDHDGDGARQLDLSELSALEDQREGHRLRLVEDSDNDGKSLSSSSLAASADASTESNGESDGFARSNTVGNTGHVCGTRVPYSLAYPSPNVSQSRTVENLQRSLLFTERQSQRFIRWLRDAERAAEKGGLPSKSAAKLQGQKSKKQKQKELRIERKAKKRGGRK